MALTDGAVVWLPGATTIIWGVEKKTDTIGIGLAAVHGVLGVSIRVIIGLDILCCKLKLNLLFKKYNIKYSFVRRLHILFLTHYYKLLEVQV